MVMYHEKILNPSEVKNISEIIENPYENLQEGYDIISLCKDEDNISIFNTFIKFRDRLIDIKKGFYDWDKFFKETVKLTEEEIKDIKLHMFAVGPITSHSDYKRYIKDDEILFNNIIVGETNAYSKYKLRDKYLFIDHKSVPSYEEYRPSFIVKEINRYYVDIDYSDISQWYATEDCDCSSVSSLAVVYDNKTLEKIKKIIRESTSNIDDLKLNEYEIVRIV